MKIAAIILCLLVLTAGSSLAQKKSVEPKHKTKAQTTTITETTLPASESEEPDFLKRPKVGELRQTSAI